MPNTSNKPFRRTQSWMIEPDEACFKRLLLPKVIIDGNCNFQDLRKLRTCVGTSMLTHLYFQVLDERFIDLHLIKILKTAKNLKKLTLNFGYAAERLSLKTLFKTIGLLKLRSLTIIYSQNESDVASNFMHELIVLLHKIRTLQKLKLKFMNVIFHERFNSIPYRLSCHKLTKLQLSFKHINSNIDMWMVPFSRAVGKALYKHLTEPKIIHLHISKHSCPKLTPLGISKFLANFDKIHLTNYVNLKIQRDYWHDETYPNYNFGDLFLMFIKRQAKFKLNSLKISNESLSQDFAGFVKKNQNLPMNSLYLKINDDWNANRLRETMKCVKLFQPKKEIKVVFPDLIRRDEEEDDFYSESDEDEETDSERDNQGHLLEIVLLPLFCRISKNMSVYLDFTECLFDHEDYEFLQNILADVHKPISYLNLKLPPQNVDNDLYPTMDEGEMLPAIISLVCSMFNVITCSVNINELQLKNFGNYGELKKDFKMSSGSSLEKLIIEMDETQLKPKVLLRILKIFRELTKLEIIEVSCSETVFEACKSIQLLKTKSRCRPVLCNFVPNSNCIWPF